ncbi:hypothetical protein [Agrobacterium rosae]|uniref:hypothetical protein n=1 Tax=Agrobacterium rosae TaxID=1972867 RepID=UPI003B9EDC45
MSELIGRNLGTTFLILLASFSMMSAWALISDPILLKRMTSETCDARFAELRKASDGDGTSQPSTRFLRSNFSSVVYPVSLAMEKVVLERFEYHGIRLPEALSFRVYDTGHITIHTYDGSNQRVGSYDFDYCGQMF